MIASGLAMSLCSWLVSGVLLLALNASSNQSL